MAIKVNWFLSVKTDFFSHSGILIEKNHYGQVDVVFDFQFILLREFRDIGIKLKNWLHLLLKWSS